MRPRSPRLPLQPVLDAAGVSSPSMLAERLGLDRGEVYRWSRAGGVTELWADRLATMLARHPVELWPDLWPALLEEPEPVRTCEECGTPIYSLRPRRFCSQRCSGNAWRRRKYAEDPEYRAARLADVARYQQANVRARKVKRRIWDASETRRASQRAYYVANRDRILAWQREYNRKRGAA